LDAATQPRSSELTGKAAAFYCPTGTTSRISVSTDYYTTPETSSSSARTGQAKCGTDEVCKNGIRYAVTGWKQVCIASPETGVVTGDVAISEGSSNSAATENIKVVSHYDKAKDEDNFDSLTFQSTPVCSIAGSSCTASNKPSGCGSSSDVASAPTKINDLEWVIKSGSSGFNFQTCQQYSVTIVPYIGSTSYGPTCALLINVVNTNDAPTWSGNTLTETRTVPERSSLNYALSPAVTAVDVDVGQELNYELTSDGDGNFRIGSCSGVIYVAKDGVLDYVAKSSYTLSIKVTDDPNFFSPSTGSGLSITGSVTITVTNINDPPT
jgi:hypothetical protein